MSTNELVKAYKKLSSKDKKLFWEQVSDNNNIVAWTVDGKPLTAEEYIAEIQIGLDQIEQGKTISDEELQKQMETW